MGKGYQVNGEKLREIMKSMGYGTSSEEIERFCTEVAKVSPQSLKRWLANGGVHRDTLETLAEKLSVSSWKELRLDEETFTLTDEQRAEAPFEITIYVHNNNARYKKVIEAIRTLLVAFGIKVVIHVTKVKRGSLIITMFVNGETLDHIMYEFNMGGLRRLDVKQINISSSCVRFLIDGYYTPPPEDPLHDLRRTYQILHFLYETLEFRLHPQKGLMIRQYPPQKPAQLSLQE